MTTLASRPDLENPMVAREPINMDDYLIDTADPEDMALYVYDMSKTPEVINEWLYGADLNVSQADAVYDAMSEAKRNALCAKWVANHDVSGYIQWRRKAYE